MGDESCGKKEVRTYKSPRIRGPLEDSVGVVTEDITLRRDSSADRERP